MAFTPKEFDEKLASIFKKENIDPSVVLGLQAIKQLLCYCEFNTILDVGSGPGIHTRIFKEFGKEVFAVDANSVSTMRMERLENPDLIGDYNEMMFDKKFDVVWCCHVLEHQRNIGRTIDKLLYDVKDNGVLAITVPPLKTELVGGHLSLWNAGLLIYNLVIAGNDCSDARVKRYGYNISALVYKRSIDLPEALVGGRGDLEMLSGFFPFKVHQDIDGEISSANWVV